MTASIIRTAVAMAATFLFVACASSPPAPEPVSVPGLKNAHIVGDVVLASQPTKEAVAALEQRYGIKTVLNLRQPEEVAPLGETDWVASLGLEYINIGFREPATLTDDVFDRIRAVLRDPTRRPILVHCSSANRVGAAWYAYRVLDEGADPAEALAEAKATGLRKPGHIQRALDYVAARLSRRKTALDHRGPEREGV